MSTNIRTSAIQASALGSIPAGTSIGHIHLKVADLDRAVTFYHDIMGFDLVGRTVAVIGTGKIGRIFARLYT